MAKTLFLICLVAAVAYFQVANAQSTANAPVAPAPVVPLSGDEAMPVPGQQWRQEVRQAVDGAAERVQINLITVLSGMAVSSASAGRNVTTALATLTRAVVNNTFDLAGVVAYMPRLLVLDLPTQFVELLTLIRRNEVRIPSDVNGAIDTVLALSRQSQDSGINRQLFEPVSRFLPNMFTGISDFLTSIIDNTFSLLAGVPVPPPRARDNINQI